MTFVDKEMKPLSRLDTKEGPNRPFSRAVVSLFGEQSIGIVWIEWQEAGSVYVALGSMTAFLL